MVTPIQASDGTDYLYSKHDRNWRVRVRVNNAQPTVAPINGEPVVEPAAVGLCISVSLLDADGEVAKNEAGELRIFPGHVLTIKHDRTVDVEAEIEQVIQVQIDAAERQLAGRDNLKAALARFQ